MVHDLKTIIALNNKAVEDAKHALPFDCSRCKGEYVRSDGSVEKCELRGTCRRYLSRKINGPRAPVFTMPPMETTESCSHYWGVETQREVKENAL